MCMPLSLYWSCLPLETVPVHGEVVGSRPDADQDVDLDAAVAGGDQEVPLVASFYYHHQDPSYEEQDPRCMVEDLLQMVVVHNVAGLREVGLHEGVGLLGVVGSVPCDPVDIDLGVVLGVVVPYLAFG